MLYCWVDDESYFVRGIFDVATFFELLVQTITSRGGSRIFSSGGGGFSKKNFENFVDFLYNHHFFRSTELIF